MKVVLNVAISADGKMSVETGLGSQLTSQRDLERLWHIRASVDAIMVSHRNLEENDKMTLTLPCYLNPSSHPERIIVSKAGNFNFKHPVFQTEGGHIHLVTLCEIEPVERDDVSVHIMTLSDFLLFYRQRNQAKTLLCEGGGGLARSLVELDVVSEIYLTIAGHILVGSGRAPGMLGGIGAYLKESQVFTVSHFEPLSNGECFLRYTRARIK